MTNRATWLLAALAVQFGILSQAMAAATNETTVYEGAQLQALHATTAEDLLNRIPGGSAILERDSNAGPPGQQRGFGNDGAQVLINGRRMSGKANDVGAALRRIDALQIARVELIRDTSNSLDVASQGIVINIVLVKGGKKSQRILELGAPFTENGRLDFVGLLAYSGSSGDADYQASVQRDVRAPPSFGPPRYSDRFRDERYFFADGRLMEQRPQSWRRKQQKLSYTANIGATTEADQRWQLNGLYETFESHDLATTPLTRFDPAGAVLLRATETQVHDTDARKTLEFGGDYERRFGDDLLKLLFIVARRSQPALDVRDQSAGPVLTQLSRSDIIQKTNEDIIRSSFTFPAKGQKFELGGEAARNRLQQKTQLFGDVNNDGRVDPILLSEPDARVQEVRGETYVKVNGQLAARLSQESSLTAEFSRITSSYVAYPPRSYFFLKPRVDLRWQKTALTQWGLRVERKVEQLEFNNFVPVYDGLSDRLLAGNPGIAPESSWQLEMRREQRLDQDRGTVETRLYFEAISGEIDKMVIGRDANNRQISASGNIGNARVYGFEGKFSVRLNLLGVAGGIVNGRLRRQFSRTHDPFTDEARHVRGRWPAEFSLGYRQDLAALGLSFGVEFNDQGGQLDGSDLFVREFLSIGPRLDAFVQKSLGPVTLRFEAQQFTGAEEFRNRTIFVDSQTTGTVLRRESFTESRDRRFVLKLRTTF